MRRRTFLSSVAAGAGALTVGTTQASSTPNSGNDAPTVPALHAPGVLVGGITFVKLPGSAGSVYVNPADIAAVSASFGQLGAATTITLASGGTVTVSGTPDAVIAAMQAQLAP